LNADKKNKKIRIAVICPGFGLIPRGIETVVKEIFYSLAPSGKYSINIFCGGKHQRVNPPENIKIINIQLPEFPSFFSKIYKKIALKLRLVSREEFDYSFLIFSVKLFFKLFFRKYDLIFNNGGIYCGLICKLYRFFHNTPFIHTGHAGINTLEFKLALQKPDVYIALSGPAEKWITEKLPYQKTHLIPNGLRPELFFPKKITEENLGLGYKLARPVFLYVGALTQQKQPDRTIDAFAINKIGSLIIIGDGPLKNLIISKASSLFKDKSKFLYIQNVDNDKIPDYFNFCDYFIMPSQNECFGLVYATAMACNKPVIAEDAEIQRWMIEDGGLFCNTTDTKDIADKMQDILKIDFGNKPLLRSKKFHLPELIKKYENIINEWAKK